MMKNITRLRLCIEECAYISVVMQITTRRPGELGAQLTGASDRLVASLAPPSTIHVTQLRCQHLSESKVFSCYAHF